MRNMCASESHIWGNFRSWVAVEGARLLFQGLIHMNGILSLLWCLSGTVWKWRKNEKNQEEEEAGKIHHPFIASELMYEDVFLWCNNLLAAYSRVFVHVCVETWSMYTRKHNTTCSCTCVSLQMCCVCGALIVQTTLRVCVCAPLCTCVCFG